VRVAAGTRITVALLRPAPAVICFDLDSTLCLPELSDNGIYRRSGPSASGPDPEVVHTLELGVETEQGYIGLEELVEVTEDGAEYFHEPQRELRALG